MLITTMTRVTMTIAMMQVLRLETHQKPATAVLFCYLRAMCIRRDRLKSKCGSSSVQSY